MPNHPDLAKKLRLLYTLQVNPSIRSHTELASALGISKQAISKWMHGTDTGHGDRIPLVQVEKLSNLFAVPQHWFAKTYVEFEELIFGKLDSKEEPAPPRPEKISISQLPTTSLAVFGREAELEILDTVWSQKITNVLQIVAFGGVGKSCLVNYWLAYLNERNYAGAKRIYAWSFYWQGAASDVKSTGDFFIEHALDWFGDQNSAKGTPWAKAIRLAGLIRESRTLLLLDGLEPLQRPPGPNAGLIENPAVSYLIKELATDNNGLCVITTRLPVAELESYKTRIRTITLGELSEESSIQLLKSLGVGGAKDEILKAVNKYSFHPLSLTLLAGYLGVVYQGDIQKFQELRSLFDELSRGGHAKKIMSAYLDWFENRAEIELLYLICLVDRAVPLSEIKLIANRENVEGLTSSLQKLSISEWSYAIKNLCDSQLLSKEKYGSDFIIDAHPIVRDFFSEHLLSNMFEVWSKGHNMIFNYLCDLPIRTSLNMVDLEPLFRAVIHGARAQKYNEAFSVYFSRS